MTDTPKPTRRHRFLVVDDEPDMLDSIRRLFRRDYDLFMALSTDEAYTILENEEIHIVMSDQRMPELSGVEFLTEVKRRYPAAVRMLFTGYGDVNAVIDSINQGNVYRYIHKPFDPAELRVVVRQAAERYDMLAERERMLTELAKQNEQLRSLDRMKNAFIEVVNHELNTPTAIILGYASLLQRDTLLNDSVTRLKAVGGIKSSGMRLKSISEKIAKMMASESLSLDLHLEPIDARVLVNGIVAELEPVLTMRNQSLEVKTGSAPLVLQAERAYLYDLLMNLVVNAIKFSPDGSTIWMTAGPNELEGRPAIEFRVRDEGIGIPDEDRDQIFNTFFGTFRSQHHSSGDFGFEQRGLGLGLAIVKRFAEMHGGTVSFESQVEEGTEFQVLLPVEPPL
jgi:signal transduction histidine kinase